MQALYGFAAATLCRLVDWTLYHVGDWRKVGEAEAFLASCLAGLEAHSFEPINVPFVATVDSQKQFQAASTALRRLTKGWTTGKRSGNAVEHPARYPMFRVDPVEFNVPTTYEVTVKNPDGSTEIKTRKARAGINVTLSTAYLVSQIEAANADNIPASKSK